MFSKSCEYGIRAAIYVAKHSRNNHKVSLIEVAKHTDSPPAFMAKILQKLTKTEILSSLKGPTGGFFITEEHLNTISLLSIVLAIDGDGIFENCTLGLRRCDGQKPCPMHFNFRKIREEMRETLSNTSLKLLAEEVSDGITFLKR
ncbi:MULTISPECIES: Rrf2 family transcriptional regulator [Chryseobacterium]|uniref:HTH-type transcriptional regulator IscR n=1 Tax=Chryseobacterium salivictor TaxID=2547600 RepID=A0A4P6ZCR0_9FLAO|nr:MULTISPECIES: Rrf2 family transcriptional regulator [Chryseobacterium]MDQ0476920.1 Rrf2 family iron-sulfur cluster assembly transcriptional regulator [Chryseobacterium sp. MDT2-18]QBO57283.1 HTH-type transcriptional regulator IscR [Chryseobacterium salivictor]